MSTGCVERSSLFVPPPEIGASCTPIDEAPSTPLRMVTWNIRAGLSSSLDVIGEVLVDLDADVVALQEVDYEAERTGGVDQAGALAERLAMQPTFVAARFEGSGHFGVALLSRLPFLRAARIDLPSDGAFEPRVAVDATVCAGGKPVRVVSVHADIYPWSAEQNAEALAEAMDNGSSDRDGVIVAGDLNASPTDAPAQAFTGRGFVDAIAGRGDAPTFADRRIDYVFVNAGLASLVEDAQVDDVDASDHRPMFVDLDLPAG